MITLEELANRVESLESRVDSLESLLPDINELSDRVEQIGDYGRKTREELEHCIADIDDCLQKADLLIEFAKDDDAANRGRNLRKRLRARKNKATHRLSLVA